MMQGLLYQRYQVAMHVLFWVSYLALVLYALANRIEFEEALVHACLQVGTLILLVYANLYFFMPRLFRRGTYWRYVLAVLGLLVVVTTLRLAIAKYMGLTLTSARLASMPLPLDGFFISFTLGLIFIALSSAYYVLNTHARREQHLTRQHNQQLETELKLLRAQINPHFLFNALNGIYSLVYRRSEQAAPMLLRLSGMMRYLLEESDRAYVPLSREVTFIEEYVHLQCLRFGNQEQVTLHLDNQAPGAQVAPMLLIILVENAFQHGQLDQPGTWVRIELRANATKLHFEVNNWYRSPPSRQPSAGIGLENARKRLAYLYPGRHQLHTGAEGTTFRAMLQLDL